MIRCCDLHKHFGEVKSVNGINIEIPDGTFLGLLGPNGAGKTTLIRMMTSLLIPTSGHVEFDGAKMDKDAVEIKAAIGVTSQHMNLDKELSVEENMEFSGRLYHMDRASIQQGTDKLLHFLNLDQVRRRPVKKLSGGMQRKLMIARALLHNPKYLFLDEPTVGIDPNIRRDIWDFLQTQYQEGKTILLTTHYIEEAQHLCDKVLLIDQGEIFQEGTSQELIKKIGTYKVEYMEEGRTKTKYSPTLNEAKEQASRLDCAYSVGPTTLEDVFFYYTNKGVGGWK